ncbi:hypothetical protein [Sinorhizobium americanum]|uniref:Uncharacterized protein n=1 Tax=Sinorhizobium americanum TaxID=194963 RepID=A0A1L3LNB4_9HYPH|nr:hypothetical protein [Sinorhizobium americanum]APG91571.1 hypothetical protein SAMCFNEI73_Ch2288 [Sinorhizobium americanum]OAP49056.1 hypothetical protein ATC00_16810 [Sinorhizobium americanum]
MHAETYAVINLAALNLIEAVSAAYFVTEEESAARHEFRAREMLKKVATALGYEVTAVVPGDRSEEGLKGSRPSANGGLRLVPNALVG